MTTTTITPTKICFILNIVRNKYLFKIILKELKMVIYKDISRLNWYLNFNKIEILREKMERNHYLSFNSTRLYKIFQIKYLKNDYQFYLNFFQNYKPIHKDYLDNVNHGIQDKYIINKEEEVIVSIIQHDCIGAFKALTEVTSPITGNKLIVPSFNLVIDSFRYKCFKIFKFLLSNTIVKNEILSSQTNISTLWTKIFAIRQFSEYFKFALFLINEIGIPFPTTNILSSKEMYYPNPFEYKLSKLINGCILISILNLPISEKQTQSSPISHEPLITMEEIKEIQSSKTKIEMKSTVSSFSSQDKSIQKLLLAFNLAYEGPIEKNLHYWLKFKSNDKISFDTVIISSSLDWESSLKYGNYQLLSKINFKYFEKYIINLFEYKKVERNIRTKSKRYGNWLSSVSNGGNDNKLYRIDNSNGNFKKILFENCKDHQSRIQFISMTISGFGNNQSTMNPIYLIILLINFNDLELLQFACSQFNLIKNNSYITNEIVNCIIRNIQSIEILDYLYSTLLYHYFDGSNTGDIDLISVQSWIDLSRIELVKRLEELIPDNQIIKLNNIMINSLVLHYIIVEKSGGSDNSSISKYKLPEFDQVNFSPRSKQEVSTIISIISNSSFKYYLFRPYHVPDNTVFCDHDTDYYLNYSPYRIQLFEWIFNNRKQDLDNGRLIINKMELYELLYLINQLSIPTSSTLLNDQDQFDYLYQRVGEQGDIQTLESFIKIYSNENKQLFKSNQDTGFIRLLFGAIEHCRIDLIEYIDSMYPLFLTKEFINGETLNLNRLEIYDENYFYDFNKRCYFSYTDTVLVTNKEFKSTLSQLSESQMKTKQKSNYKIESQRYICTSSYGDTQTNEFEQSTTIKKICESNNHLNLYYNYFNKKV